MSISLEDCCRELKNKINSNVDQIDKLYDLNVFLEKELNGLTSKFILDNEFLKDTIWSVEIDGSAASQYVLSCVNINLLDNLQKIKDQIDNVIYIDNNLLEIYDQNIYFYIDNIDRLYNLVNKFQMKIDKTTLYNKLDDYKENIIELEKTIHLLEMIK